MLRPTATKYTTDGERRHHLMPQRNRVSSPYLPQGMRFINVRVAIPNDFEEFADLYESMPPTISPLPFSPIPPDTAASPLVTASSSSSTSLSFSPLTTCSESWTPSAFGVPAKSPSLLPPPLGFVPIQDRDRGSNDLSPFSKALRHDANSTGAPPSVYRPCATLSSRETFCASPATTDTCSVTTLGTNYTSTTMPVPTVLFPNSSLALTANSPAFSMSKAKVNNISNNNTIQCKRRPQSAPTFPVSNDDTQQRKIRIKTELCMHYQNGRQCPFGNNCTYAHGQEELQMTKLRDLHNNGLVDVETYRTKPCLAWVMTGSCPFGKRCTGVHDSRVHSAGAQSWLPHTETQGNTIATDINVDGLHQKRLHTILYDNPFGNLLDLETAKNSVEAAWQDLYGIVCGEKPSTSKSSGLGWNSNYSKKCRPKSIHPIYKLQIALKLRGDSDWTFKYRPQHIVHDEMCLVLNKRAYRVQSNDSTSTTQRLTINTATATSSVVEITLNAYNARLQNHILVHEIAFGPDSDPSVRGVALWFNLDKDDVTVCTPQQAKRFRWKKTTGVAERQVKIKTSVFDSGMIDSFPMIRPHDDAAFRLTTDMLKHRLAVLKRELVVQLKDRHENLQKLQLQKESLQLRLKNQMRDWVAWAWPINVGREKADLDTPVPPVEGPYLVKDISGLDENIDSDRINVKKGAHVNRIWASFVDQCPLLQCNSLKHLHTHFEPNLDHNIVDVIPSFPHRYRRLEIFENLSHGKEIDLCRILPHIVKHRATPNDTSGSKVKTTIPSQENERCWKALLLQPKSPQERNEWEIVRDHFENSRSKKVLSILQQ